MAKSSTSRRELLKSGAVATLSVGLAGCDQVSDDIVEPVIGNQDMSVPDQTGITQETFAQAERLFGVEYSEAEREQMLSGIDDFIETATRHRAVDKPNGLAPACVFDPRIPGREYRTQSMGLRRSAQSAGALPADDSSIAFAPVWKLSAWIARGDLTSARLTEIYLSRIEQYGDRLECFVTVTPQIARSEAARCDAELASGRSRGPLHGIPYGMKDIIDVADVRASWGAVPYQDRIAQQDARVTVMLREAGAVLLGKTTNGAIAYGDQWFGGTTRNPWNINEGSSGSSAGSAAATGAALIGFGIGTETLGSIVSPSNRCGTTGLRPTFGRVSRTGAMALCWSLDKIGPITRSVEDTAFVLDAINGPDVTDVGNIDMGLDIDVDADVRGMRVGWNPEWFENGSDADRAALDAARAAGVELVEVSIPELPYNSLLMEVEAEAAAAFESLTLTNADDTMRWQDPQAWPNTWRRARFISAVDLINVNRFRRQVMDVMDGVFDGLDAMIGPNFTAGLLLITNYTGHPQLAFRSGFSDQPTRSPVDGVEDAASASFRVPQTTSLWGPLFEEGRMIALGRELESRLGVSNERPPTFS
jgi:Asp-tRNA(Asn)/Glu-tRNA(Gln) amidotransferase A subunit family amidase